MCRRGLLRDKRGGAYCTVAEGKAMVGFTFICSFIHCIHSFTSALGKSLHLSAIGKKYLARRV